MKPCTLKKTDQNSNGWFWIGIGMCVFVAMNKGNRERSSSQSKAEVAGQRIVTRVPVEAEMPLFRGHFINVEDEPEVLVEDEDKDGKSAESRVIVTDRNGELLTETVHGQVRTAVDSKVAELEKRLMSAREKVREATERASSRVSERTQRVIVTTIPDHKPDEPLVSLPPVPPVPPVPPLSPIEGFGPSSTVESGSEKPRTAKITIRSAPCAEQPKAIGEVKNKLDQIVAQRLEGFGLSHPRYVEKVVAGMKRTVHVEESFREFAGERHPLYVASMEVDLGQNFERQALQLINQQVAHRRFSALMGFSFGLVVLLIGIDRLVLGRTASHRQKNWAMT